VVEGPTPWAADSDNDVAAVAGAAGGPRCSTPGWRGRRWRARIEPPRAKTRSTRHHDAVLRDGFRTGWRTRLSRHSGFIILIDRYISHHGPRDRASWRTAMITGGRIALVPRCIAFGRKCTNWFAASCWAGARSTTGKRHGHALRDRRIEASSVSDPAGRALDRMAKTTTSPSSCEPSRRCDLP
jgi:hypothetical protein